MSVRNCTVIKKYQGLSTDTKPTTNVLWGSEFYEVNAVTNKLDKIYTYVADNGTGVAGWVVTQGLLSDANLKVGDADVSATNPVPVYQATQDRTVSATVTRPSDTTAYAVGDVLSDSTSSPTILTFEDVVSDLGGTGCITSATMIASDTTVGSIRLMLFHGAAPTAINDNAAFAPSDSDAAKCIGWFDFDSYQETSNNRIFFDCSKLVQFKCGSGLADIYAIPVVQGAFTPTSGATYTFNLGISNGIMPFNSNAIQNISATVTRPADTNAYAANDVLSGSTSSPNILTFADVVTENGGKGQITGGTLVIDAASTPSIRLMLFHGAAPTAINDNAAFAPSDAEAARCIGWLDFDTPQAGSGNTIYQDASKLLQFECGSAVNDIYGIPVVQGAFTPVSGSAFTFTLNVTRA